MATRSQINEAHPDVENPRRLARTAGLYYLVVAVLGPFALLYVPERVYVPGDAAATAANLVANESLVRLGLVADLAQATFMLFVVLALYRLLHHVGRNTARAMVVFVAVAVAIMCLNAAHQLGAVLVATDPAAYASALGADGSDAVVLLLLDLQHHGVLVAQIFFGLWLFPMGLLAYRSTMLPRLVGILLMAATCSYLLDVLLQLLAPELADAASAIIVVPPVLGEVSLLAYLLIKGVKQPVPAAQSSPSPPGPDADWMASSDRSPGS